MSLEPDLPVARFVQVDCEDMAGGALTDQKRSAIRMHRATVYEGGVRKFAPSSNRAVPPHSVDISGLLAQRPGGHPKRAAGIKGESHRRRGNLRECGRRACRRIIAI